MMIIHYRSKCVGCNACVEADKNRWRISRNDGKSILLGSTINKGVHYLTIENDEYHSLLKAVNICPVKIIKLVL